MSLTYSADTCIRRLCGHIKHWPHSVPVERAYKRHFGDQTPQNRPSVHTQCRVTALHRLGYSSCARSGCITCCVARRAEVASSKRVAKYAGRQLPLLLLSLVLLSFTLTARLAVQFCHLATWAAILASTQPLHFSGVRLKLRTVFCFFWMPYMQVCMPSSFALENFIHSDIKAAGECMVCVRRKQKNHLCRPFASVCKYDITSVRPEPGSILAPFAS